MRIFSLLLAAVLLAESRALKPIHLTIVACGSRLEEALTSLKSSLIFTPGPIVFHVFTEDHLRGEFQAKIDAEWPVEYTSKFRMEFYPIEFTRGDDERWRNLFKPCCTQRLFIRDILQQVDSVLYVDTDTLFLSNVRHLWRLFRKFNETQLAALTPEHENPAMGWYNRFARHPYYGAMGLNSGVMLMNLTRMRQANMISKIMDIFDEYHMNITWGDQCLLNIYFHHHPEQLYEFTCDWNYRPDHCMYENNCAMASKDGIKIVHGCRSAFHNDKYEEFKAIYQVIHNWHFDSDLRSSLLSPIKVNLQRFSATNCGKAQDLFTQHFARQIASQDHSATRTFHIALIHNDHWNFIEQAYIALKSVLLFSSNKTQFHLHVIATDPIAQQYFSREIEPMGFAVTYYNASIQHPFHLSRILKIDRVVYLNPSMIFVKAFEEIWSLFDRFQPAHVIGMFGHCHISGSSNMLLLRLAQMQSLALTFEGVSQLTTENVYFIPCEYMLDPDHCPSIADGLFLPSMSTHSLFGILSQLISETDLRENDLSALEHVHCRNELVKVLRSNKHV